MTIKERIENLTKQQEKAKEVYVKCLGAFSEALIKEEQENKKNVKK